ncbi:hypothetical protein QNH39_18775 [Neobacillus novalis]|uniref:Uncharacterized protein n=1 Tax=Neobacillus novalis TaxID=220687 RepID=A0AA95MMB8_9BACI|nr:hypothetical protein [Neobacillus novalis]WHY84683.1 hypothetical protein QNH39_18775 [Neobacillus novalis]
MIKKFKNVISQLGTGNIAILKSKNVTVNNVQAMDELSKLIQKGNLLGAAKLLLQMKKFVNSQHPAAPHYKYEFSEDKSGNIITSIVPAYPEAPLLHPLKGSFNFILPEKYQKFNNMNELLNYSYGNQENIELDVVAFKTWVDETIIDEHHKKDFATMKLTLIPIEFPPPTPMRLYLKGHSWSIDYLEIGVTKIDGSIVIMDNHKQKHAPFYVQFMIDIANSRADMKIEINDEFFSSVKHVLMFKEFVQLSNKKSSHELALKMLKEDSDIFIAKEWHFNEDKSDETEEFLDLLRKLRQIEDKLQVNFTLPSHGFITENELNIINLIYSSVNNGSLKEKLTKIYSLKMRDGNEIASLLSLHKTRKDGFSICLNDHFNVPISLFGVEFSFNIYQIFLNNITLKDAELLDRKLAMKNDEEELIVKLKPVDTEAYLFQRLYTDSEKGI